MPAILLDGQALEAAGGTDTWGALLEHLDDLLEPKERIVTDVRLDGIDEPAFRDRAVLDRALADVAVVEVGTGTRGGLVERCLAEAIDSIDPLCTEAIAAGRRFRSMELAEAGVGLAQIAEGLSSLVGLVGATSLALGVDLDRVSDGGQPLSGRLGELAGFVEDLVAARQSGDWITVADILQYDVEPALRRWQPLLRLLSDGAIA